MDGKWNSYPNSDWKFIEKYSFSLVICGHFQASKVYSQCFPKYFVSWFGMIWAFVWENRGAHSSWFTFVIDGKWTNYPKVELKIHSKTLIFPSSHLWPLLWLKKANFLIPENDPWKSEISQSISRFLRIISRFATHYNCIWLKCALVLP